MESFTPVQQDMLKRLGVSDTGHSPLIPSAYDARECSRLVGMTMDLHLLHLPYREVGVMATTELIVNGELVVMDARQTQFWEWKGGGRYELGILFPCVDIVEEREGQGEEVEIGYVKNGFVPWADKDRRHVWSVSLSRDKKFALCSTYIGHGAACRKYHAIVNMHSGRPEYCPGLVFFCLGSRSSYFASWGTHVGRPRSVLLEGPGGRFELNLGPLLWGEGEGGHASGYVPESASDADRVPRYEECDMQDDADSGVDAEESWSGDDDGRHDEDELGHEDLMSGLRGVKRR